MSDALTVLRELRRATDAALSLAEQLAASRSDADEWTRLPAPSSRCRITGFSRSKIVRLINAGLIRGKSVGAARFYCGADLRRMIRQAGEPPPKE